MKICIIEKYLVLINGAIMFLSIFFASISFWEIHRLVWLRFTANDVIRLPFGDFLAGVLIGVAFLIGFALVYSIFKKADWVKELFLLVLFLGSFSMFIIISIRAHLFFGSSYTLGFLLVPSLVYRCFVYNNPDK